VDGNIQDCVLNNLDGCDAFLEEDCTYYGRNLNLDPPDGEVVSPFECEALCKGFRELGCSYWVFNAWEQSCKLMSSGDRYCYSVSGPRYPGISDCL